MVGVPPASAAALPLPRVDQPASVAAWEERRLAAVLSGLSEVSTVIGGITCAFSAPGSWINQSVNVPLGVPLAAGTLEAITDFYASRGAEPKICITPFVHATVLGRLADAGYVLRTIEHVLAIDVSGVASAPPPVAPEALALVPVDPADADQVETYVAVHCHGFYGASTEAVQADSARRSVHYPGARPFLVRWGSETVGVAAFEAFGPVGALYGAAVLEPWRRRGIQSAVIAARLQHMRAAGLSVAAIASLPGEGTERNALRAGLRPCYARLEMVRPGPGLVPSP